MEIYLIRHTTPMIEKDICYGQSDIDVTESFQAEVEKIKEQLPDNIQYLLSSPLQRCRKLAAILFPSRHIVFRDELKELHFGEWEMKKWNDIPQPDLQIWMDDFIHAAVPGGESYWQLYIRAITCFKDIARQNVPTAIISHGGVIRSILSYVTKTPLKNSFKAFSLPYGCLVKLTDQCIITA